MLATGGCYSPRAPNGTFKVTPQKRIMYIGGEDICSLKAGPKSITREGL